jgi:cytidine deaminase
MAAGQWYETPPGMDQKERATLIGEAHQARRNAVAPYSRFQVGAALRAADGSIYRGCNVENGTYGLTMCAERVAIFTAIAAGARRFTAIAVTAPGPEGSVTPCGACRQLLWEHCGDIEVVVANLDGQQVEHQLSSLLPNPFEFRRPT